MIASLSAVCLMALLQADVPPAPPNPEIAINLALEELRKGELFLDAIALEPYMAASVTIVEGGFRLSGSFAYLEGIRRMKERGGKVQTLAFSDVLPRVFGDAAVVTYQYDKVWVDEGTRHHEAGWCTDVLVNRDGSGWVLVERHRAKGK
jgi:hypothetical protein